MTVELPEALKAHLKRRDALFRNPTLEAATEYLHGQGHYSFLSPETPLAMVHKARLQWLDATDEMLAESLEWLESHDWKPGMGGAPPLTPATRDAERMRLGKPPLNEARQ